MNYLAASTLVAPDHGLKCCLSLTSALSMTLGNPDCLYNTLCGAQLNTAGNNLCLHPIAPHVRPQVWGIQNEPINSFLAIMQHG